MTISNGYLTINEAQDYIGRQFADADGVLGDIVTTASRTIDRHCGRHFYQVSATRYFDADASWRLNLGPYNDLVTLTTLKADDDGDGIYELTYTSGQYELLPKGAASRAPVAEPFTKIELLDNNTFPLAVTSGRKQLVEVAGTWGWPSVPIEVKQACRLLVHEYAKLQDAPFGMMGSAEFGMSRIPPQKQRHVRELLAPYVHPRNVGIG